MSMHIVDDEQRGDRPATPMRPSGSGGAGASAALALLDDVRRQGAGERGHIRRASDTVLQLRYGSLRWGGTSQSGRGCQK